MQFFAEMPLAEVHIGNLETYIEQRQADGVGASLIRHEVSCLKQILDRAALWTGTELERFYKPPELKKSNVGRALEYNEKERLLAIASSKKRWQVAYYCTIVMLLGVDAGELTAVHVSDFDFSRRLLRVRDGLKNLHRDRIVSLENPQAYWAMGKLLKRYYRLCGEHDLIPNPEHYILPGRLRNGTIDPTKRMTSWKRAWQKIKREAGVQVRRKDLRHDAITTLGEAGIPAHVIAAHAGHVDEKMQEHYFHAHLEPLRAASLKIKIPIPHAIVENVDNQPEPDPNLHQNQTLKKSAQKVEITLDRKIYGV